ncbi:MAG: bifunctional adenosylcobinamide kinase/adenosylcobinamide-phosphate guanylyltransferase [Lachnospiraceae bacterium]|nr:bifunctional adenosylcobinamide kinase/adenosylcobinamide-phosphate guanylyltransferase [Lachnospiraceae bacterium]
MLTFIIGKANSGKSKQAEKEAVNSQGINRYYLATMKIYDKEGELRVQRHRALRKDKGFITLECPYDIKKTLSLMEEPDKSTLLLECAANLAGNELYENPLNRELMDRLKKEKAPDRIHFLLQSLAEKIEEDIDYLNNRVKDLLVVSSIYEESPNMDNMTLVYIRLLNMINEHLKNKADRVIRTGRCILLRHGKTDGNLEKRYEGCATDRPLNSSDIKCMEKLKENIGRFMLTKSVIVSSPLKRACETAGFLFGDCDIKKADGLKEIDFGVFEGKTYEELKDNEAYIHFLNTQGDCDIPGGESRTSFIERSMKAFCDIVLQRNINDIFIVCHGGNIMAIMSSLLCKDYYDFWVDNLDGYILDLVVDDEKILDFTYDRIGDRLSYGSSDR